MNQPNPMTPATEWVEKIKAALVDALALAGDDFPWYDDWTCSKPSPWERKKVCEAAISLLDTLAQQLDEATLRRSETVAMCAQLQGERDALAQRVAELEKEHVTEGEE